MKKYISSRFTLIARTTCVKVCAIKITQARQNTLFINSPLPIGSLTGMTVKESGLSIGAMGAKVGGSKYTVTANVTVRFVDVETPKIVGVGMGTGTSAFTSAEISFTPFRNAANWIVPRQTNIIIGDGNTINNNTISTGDTSFGEYSVKIGAVEVSMVQARNALSKAVRDAVYGNMGILTTLNGGKKLKIKTGF